MSLHTVMGGAIENCIKHVGFAENEIVIIVEERTKNNSTKANAIFDKKNYCDISGKIVE